MKVICRAGRCALLFEPRDLWIGVFVDTERRRLYVALVPTLVLRIDL